MTQALTDAEVEQWKLWFRRRVEWGAPYLAATRAFSEVEQARAGTGERDAVLVPREPTDAMLIAAMEDTLAHFKAEGIDHNSPFDDYPKPQEQLRRCWKAMIEAALLRSPSTEKADQ
jgi:hypothetical protein